jgi:bifunctional UDP-N-acetylglucosamine pyrophosphorylase/glucosamine-1-phosphate N-acetyltransferase
MASELEFSAIVMAAGQGTRMKSATPKLLHTLAGKPMLHYPLEACLGAGAREVVVVVGHGAEAVRAELTRLNDPRVHPGLQPEQRGTGDAARCGFEALRDRRGWLLILNGDCPLITTAALEALLRAAAGATGPLALLTSEIADATGYGRVIRDAQGAVQAIREQRDCSAAERAIREFNPGMYAVRSDFFEHAVAKLSTDNAQGELYLTDLVAAAANEGGAVAVSWPVEDLHGVNDRWELVERERDLMQRILRGHARAGVTVRDPATTRIDATVQIGRDVTLERGVELRGRTVLGDGVHVDSGCVLEDVAVAAGARLLPYTVARQSRIGPGAQVGPFSHLRPESDLGEQVHVGNFVEVKKTRIGRGSKANHLAYLGDGQIGEGVNVGAGTIFCNYDGFQKHLTVLEDGVFIGSDSQLVAPITVGKNAYVGTGTTVTMNVPEDAMAIGRARQENKLGLAKRLRGKLAAAKARVEREKDGK